MTLTCEPMAMCGPVKGTEYEAVLGSREIFTAHV